MKTPDQTITDYYNFVLLTWAPCPHFKDISHLITQGDVYTDLIIEKSNLCLAWDFLHVAIGLQGEALELITEEHTEEEIGDVCYYLFILFNLLGINSEEIIDCYMEPGVQDTDLPHFTSNDDTHCICVKVEKLANNVKNAFIYNQGLAVREDDLHETALAFFHELCYFNNIQKILTDNQTKLTSRYPNLSFSTTDSAIRADKHTPPQELQ